MVRILAASALAATALAVGIAAPATAAPRSSGMAAEFPVGTCMSTYNGFVGPTNSFIDNYDLINIAAVPCTDPSRTYRVTEQVRHQVQCAPDTSYTYVTRDLVVLCVVRDQDA